MIRRAPEQHPLLLLNVDGVLAPFAAPNCPPGYRERTFLLTAGPLSARSETCGPWLTTLATQFDLAWANSPTSTMLLAPTNPTVDITGQTVEELLRWRPPLRVTHSAERRPGH